MCNTCKPNKMMQRGHFNSERERERGRERDIHFQWHRNMWRPKLCRCFSPWSPLSTFTTGQETHGRMCFTGWLHGFTVELWHGPFGRRQKISVMLSCTSAPFHWSKLTLQHGSLYYMILLRGHHKGMLLPHTLSHTHRNSCTIQTDLLTSLHTVQ